LSENADRLRISIIFRGSMWQVPLLMDPAFMANFTATEQSTVSASTD